MIAKKNISLIFFLGLLLFGCTSVSEKEVPNYNILLIVSDALRADALGCYGGEAETPNIDKLAARGVLFENAYSNAPWTLPSSVALFSGNYPSAYGHSIGQVIDSVVEKRFYIISESEFLLAEELRDRGYDALYSFENEIPKRSNILQGLVDISEQITLTPKQSQEVIQSIEFNTKDKRYRQNGPLFYYLMNTGRNFFIMKWIADPHSLYLPPAKFKRKIDVDTSQLTKEIGFYQRLGSANKEPEILNIQEVGPTLNEHELWYVKQLYLKEVESVDERIGQILKALEYNRANENTIVVFTSDHGEGFGEHGKFFHGNVYYEEMVHVPLIISGPGVVKGKRIRSLVSHIDLMPTLSDLLKADCMLDAQGESYLSALVDGEELSSDRTVYLIGGKGDALRFRNYKFISMSREDEELYDLFSDPEERIDISNQEPEKVQEFRLFLSKMRQENIRRKEENMKDVDDATLDRVSRETIEKMKALGYIK
jgi:arylsulfatase A-like enzyme